MVLAVCSRDVKFYKWPNMKFLGIYEVPAECMSVKTISWSCDGKDLLVIKSKGEPLLVKAPLRPESKLSTQKFLTLSNISVGAFSKTVPSFIALGLENGDITTFDLISNELVRYKKLPSGIQNIDFSFNDQYVLAGCFDGNIFIYDRKGKPIASFMIPNCNSLSTAMLSKHANILAGAGKDGNLAVWDVETSDLLFRCKEHTGRITDISFKENYVTSISTDGYLCLFDLRAHDLISKFNLDGALSSLAYFPNSYDLAVGTYNQLRSYDIRNMNTPLRTLLINNSGHIKKILAYRSGPSMPQTGDNELYKPSYFNRVRNIEEDFSASGDFSCSSSAIPVYQKPSDVVDINKESPQKCLKTFKNSEVKYLEKYVEEYMKRMSIHFSERISETFYAMRINASKEFIALEDKINESWGGFIEYLKCSGAAEKSSPASSYHNGSSHKEQEKDISHKDMQS